MEDSNHNNTEISVDELKESELTLEIVEALKEVKQMREGFIQPLTLQDI